MGDLKAKLIIDTTGAKKEIAKIRKEAEKPIKVKASTADVVKRKELLKKVAIDEKRDTDKLRRQRIKNVEQIRIRQKKAASDHLAQSLKNIRAIALAEGRVVKRSAAQRAQMQREQNIISKKSSRSTQSIFQLQQAVEDFSFAGIRGASNNIALLASQFGGKGGIIALVGLAAVSFGQMASRMFKAGDEAEKAAKKTKKFVDVTRLLGKAREAIGLRFATQPLTTPGDVISVRGEIGGLERRRKLLEARAKDPRTDIGRFNFLRDIQANVKQLREAKTRLRRAKEEAGFARAAGKGVGAPRGIGADVERAKRQGAIRAGQRDVEQLRKRQAELVRRAGLETGVNIKQIQKGGVGFLGLGKRVTEVDPEDLKKKLEKFAEPAENARIKIKKLGAQIDELNSVVKKVQKDPAFKARVSLVDRLTGIEAETKFGGVDPRRVKIDKEIDATKKIIAQTKESLNLRLIDVKEGKKAADEQEVILTKQITLRQLVIKTIKDEKQAVKDKERAAEKASTDAKKRARDAVRDSERLAKRLEANKSGFAASLFGARVGFAAKVTGRQAERAKQFARFRGLGGAQDKNIDRFFRRVGLQRERGIVRGRLGQLTGEARAAGAAGNFQGQIGALKQRQRLEFQRSGQERNLQTSFKFLQAAQKTQEEIERIFSRKGAAQIMMTSAQIHLQAAKMQLAAVGGAVGAVGGAAAGGAGIGGARGVGVAPAKRRIIPKGVQISEVERQNIRDERERQRQVAIRTHNARLKSGPDERIQFRVDQIRIQQRRREGNKQDRLRVIEQKQQFWDNFRNNAASMLLTGFPPQGRPQQAVNQQNSNVATDNSGQVGMMVNNFSGNMTQDEINVGLEASRKRMGGGRGGSRRGRSNIRGIPA